MRKVVCSFKLPPDLRARVHAAHVETRIPKAVIAEEALEAWLARLAKPEPKKAGRK